MFRKRELIQKIRCKYDPARARLIVNCDDSALICCCSQAYSDLPIRLFPLLLLCPKQFWSYSAPSLPCDLGLSEAAMPPWMYRNAASRIALWHYASLVATRE